MNTEGAVCGIGLGLRQRIRELRDALELEVAVENISYYTHAGRPQMSEVVVEFVASALPALRAEASLRSWVADLAEYEATLWEVANLDGTFVDGLCEVLARFVEHGLVLGSR